MRHCKAAKKDGSKCKSTPLAGRPFCFFHDPERAEQRKAAQASGGARRERADAPKQAEPKDAGEGTASMDFLDLELIEGATLDDDKLEALLTTAIVRGVGGQIGAPVLANITKLIGVYEKFLDRKRDRGDSEIARKMTNDELHAALLDHIPLEALHAEISRRQGDGDKAQGPAAPAKEDNPAGHQHAGVEGDTSGAAVDDGEGEHAAADGNPPQPQEDGGQRDREPADQRVREAGPPADGGHPPVEQKRVKVLSI